MTLYERIELAMEAKGITAYKMSKDLGIHQSTIGRWKNYTSEPKSETLARISNYLGVTSDWLLNGDEGEEKDKTIYTRIPVLGVVPCGVPIEAIEDIIEWIDVVPSMGKNHFGLIAKGDSMAPYIQKGDILIIKKTPTIRSGKVGIVKVNGDDATCKKVLIGEATITLVAINSKYDPMVYTQEQVETLPVTIVGEVVEIRRRL